MKSKMGDGSGERKRQRDDLSQGAQSTQRMAKTAGQD